MHFPSMCCKTHFFLKGDLNHLSYTFSMLSSASVLYIIFNI